LTKVFFFWGRVYIYWGYRIRFSSLVRGS
jgi:hypothetical protein